MAKASKRTTTTRKASKPAAKRAAPATRAAPTPPVRDTPVRDPLHDPAMNRAALTNAATATTAPDRKSLPTSNVAAHHVKRGLHGNISDAGFIPGDARNNRKR